VNSARSLDCYAGDEVKGPLVEWANERRAADEAIGQRPVAVRALRLCGEYPSVTGVKDGDLRRSDVESSALTAWNGRKGA
jgi:hypothetical protein